MTRLFRIAAVLGMTLSVIGMNAPVFAGDETRNGYLRAVYSWRIPGLPGCGTPTAFSCKVPFVIEGKRIEGVHDVPSFKTVIEALPLPELAYDPILGEVFMMPDDPAQVINYSYTCGACKVSGAILIHKLRGKAVKRGGQENLRFNMTYSNPVCKVDCGSYNFNCANNEKVVDTFMTPIEDGYVVDRPENVIFKYLVRLE